jgi:hypothetical protein
MRSGRGGNGPSTVQQNLLSRFVRRGNGKSPRRGLRRDALLDFLAAGVLAQGARASTRSSRPLGITPHSSRRDGAHDASEQLAVSA